MTKSSDQHNACQPLQHCYACLPTFMQQIAQGWLGCRWAAYPPPPEQLQDLFELGYKDTMTWLRDNGKLAPGDAKGQNGDTAQAAPATAQEGFLKAKHGHSFSHRVAQAAMEAPSCDESLKEAVAGET